MPASSWASFFLVYCESSTRILRSHHRRCSRSMGAHLSSRFASGFVCCNSSFRIHSSQPLSLMLSPSSVRRNEGQASRIAVIIRMTRAGAPFTCTTITLEFGQLYANSYMDERSAAARHGDESRLGGGRGGGRFLAPGCPEPGFRSAGPAPSGLHQANRGAPRSFPAYGPNFLLPTAYRSLRASSPVCSSVRAACKPGPLI